MKKPCWRSFLIFLLLGGMPAFGAADTQLNWGMLTSWMDLPPEPLPPALARVIEVARTSLHLQVHPVAEFHLQGTLNIDPRHKESDRAKESFPQILDLAVCSRIAQAPLRDDCLKAASDALMAWARTYKSTGDPINDIFFVPILQAADLVAPRLQGDEARILRDWVRSLATAEDAFYRRAPKDDAKLSNNWMAARLVIRAMAARIVADAEMQTTTKQMLSEFADRNFVRNAKGEQDGTTFDFVQRDALDYHTSDLLQIVRIMLFAPETVDPQIRALVHKGIDFIRPYYVGEKQHIEFLHTQVGFDIERRLRDKNNPTFQNKPWDRKGAHTLLRLARTTFPDIRSWSSPVLEEPEDANTAFLATIYGEPESSSAHRH